jgi:putative polyhydroxyalkanoate system protein
MATISVVKTHNLTQSKAKSVAEKMAKDLHRRFDLVCTWDGNECRFTRSGLTGSMVVGEDDIALDVKLGFLLSAVAPSIERAIHEHLDAIVGEAAAGAKPSAKPAAKAPAKKKR